MAQFNIGDEVWTRSSGPWKVIGRYWLRSKQCIAYDLRYANGVTLFKMPDNEVYPTRQWYGYGMPLPKGSRVVPRPQLKQPTGDT